MRDGGDKRDRTADLLNAIQALSLVHRLRAPMCTTGDAFQYTWKINTLIWYIGRKFRPLLLVHCYDILIKRKCEVKNS